MFCHSFSICIGIFAVLVSGYSLTPPTGKYNVGLKQTVIQHTTPNDPLAPPGNATSFLVNIWYPTLQQPGYTSRAAYDPPLAKLYEDYFDQAYNLSVQGELSSLRTAVQYDSAPLLPSSHDSLKRPTLLFQPPFTGPPSQMFTCLLSDLASRGWTVVTLDHPYEQPFIQYPNGGPEFYGQAVDYEGTYRIFTRYNSIRIADAKAFLGQWSNLVTQYQAQKAFNTTHFVAFGHSIGGSASIGEVLELQAKDHQFIGGINLDGSLIGKAASSNTSAVDTKKPTLFMSSTRDADEGWEEFGSQQTAWFRYYEVNGTSHTDYSDIVLWKQWFGITTPSATKIEATRMVDLVRTWVNAFMQKVSFGDESTVVEGRSKKWPEVQFIAGKN